MEKKYPNDNLFYFYNDSCMHFRINFYQSTLKNLNEHQISLDTGMIFYYYQ
jgi:hypothetical protein